jgi:hypothetical protein
MNHQNPTLKKAMIKALEKSLGIVTTAANIAGIDRTTHYQWLKNDPEYKEAVDGIAEMTIDFVESQLHKQIQSGEVSSTIFFLKTKAKNRGYVERQEMKLDGNINLSKLQIRFE